MSDLAVMLDDFTDAVDEVVMIAHGDDHGGDLWREQPATFDHFVHSTEHLGLPPLYPRQRAAVIRLLGDDPKRIFDEPGTRQSMPLSWLPVRSSNLEAIGWHDGDLYVAFQGDTAYRYPGVPDSVFLAIAGAKSPGRMLASRVKANKLRYVKLDSPASETMIDADVDGRMFQTAVLLWGKGSGKDYLCSIIVCYLIHVLLCLRDPQRFFGLAPGEPIDLVNVAYNADQAKVVFFAKLKARIERWAWLQSNFNISEGGRRKNDHRPGRGEVNIMDLQIDFPRSIRCHSRHSQNESYEGLNVLVWLMDEASAFLSKLKRENAHKIHNTLRSSARSRFQRRWLGFIISYPRHGDDFTMQEHAKAERNPGQGVMADGPATTWDVNLATRDEERIEVRPGFSVPVSLYADFVDDFEDSMARYCCEPPAAREALIKFPQRLWDAVDKGRDPMIEWEPTTTTREVAGGKRRTYRSVKIKRFGKLPKGSRLFFHGDPASINDSFALGFGHGIPTTVMTRVEAGKVLTDEQLAEQQIDPSTFIEWEVDVERTIIDALIVWQPDPKRDMEVDLLNVKDVLLDVVKAYRIGAGSSDKWNSAETVQELQRRKVNYEDEQWSNTFQVQIYKNARRCFYNDLVSLPDHPTITSIDPLQPGFIYEMERVMLIEDRKIDHPETGSKDRADAVVRVIQHVSGQSRRRFVYGSLRDSAEAQHTVKSTRPTVDPDATPSPATPAARRADELAREQHPLGELEPATGEVRRAGRLAFGSVR